MIKINIVKLHYFLVIWLIIYVSDSIYTNVYHSVDNVIEAVTELFMFFFLVYLSKREVYRIIKYLLVFSTILFVISCINFSNTEWSYFFVIILRLSAAVIFVASTSKLKLDLFHDFSKIILIIAVLGLLCYFLFEINPFGLEGKIVGVYFPDGTIHKYLDYYNIYYRWDQNLRNFFGIKLVRANWFFREVGVYAIFLDFAVIYYLFCEKSIDYKKILILAFSIFLSQSTMGILAFLLIGFIKLIQNNIKTFIIMLPWIAIIGFSLYEVIIDKFSSVSKYASRQYNLNDAISLIEANPWFGIGCNRDHLSWYGLLNYFIFWGILGAYPVILVLIKNPFNKNIGFKFRLAFWAWFFTSLMNEAAGFNLFFMIIYSTLIVNNILDNQYLAYDKKVIIHANTDRLSNSC